MDGVRDAGGRGWLLWDPAVKYTKAALTSAKPAFIPNTLGQVPVLAYGDVAPEVLRGDLEWLLAQGFYPTTARDLASGGLHGVPAGKKAVVLTFDGSLASQFKLLEGGQVDPNCAVGVLLDFANDHPADFPARGTFFVDAGSAETTDSVFGTADLASFKLQTLVSWGFDIGLMEPAASTANGEAPSTADQEASGRLEASRVRLAALLPGYDVPVVALPPGQTFSAIASSSETPEAGADATPQPSATYMGAVLPAGGLAPSPFSPGIDPYRIPRLQAGEAGGTSWRNAIEAAEVYISGGE
jgi:hypothetical protein